MIDQLQKNQRAITTGLEDIALLQQLPEQAQDKTSTLPIDYKPAMMEPKSFVDLDAGFTTNATTILTKYQLPSPSTLFDMSKDNDKVIDDTLKQAGTLGQMLGQQKGTLSKNNKMKTKNKDKIDNLTTEIKTLQKYRARIGTLNESKKTLKKMRIK